MTQFNQAGKISDTHSKMLSNMDHNSTSQPDQSNNHNYYVPAAVELPELTLKALVLGGLLSMVLAASTCYIGLKVGRTIAASIPAAVISIAVLRWFRRANILENNMVQTIASAGEIVSAGVIFTLPALIMMGFWQEFNYWTMVAITVVGGTLGVLFSIPLRRLLIVEQKLPYPEGVATAEVLRVGATTRSSTDTNQAGLGVKEMVCGGLVSTVITVAQSGLKVMSDSFTYWGKAAGTLFGFSVSFSPVLIAAGYIVGLRICLSMLVGSLLTWGVGISIFGWINGIPEAANNAAAVMAIYKSHFRYMAIGTMAVGGVWSVLSLLPSMGQMIKSSFNAFRQGISATFTSVPRTERDIPMVYVVIATMLMVIPVFLLMRHILTPDALTISADTYLVTLGVLTAFALVVGFVCSALGAHLTGLLGTTSLPVSGIIIAAILALGTVLLMMLSDQIPFDIDINQAKHVAGITIIISAVVSIAAAISADNMQDLKAGYVIGATPWKQQSILLFGTLMASLVIPPVLNLLLNAYGFGDVLPRPDMDPSQALQAPQATMMSIVSLGVFNQNLNWSMIQLGAFIGVIIIGIDTVLKRKNSSYRLPVIPLAGGMYLPMSYILAFCLGGLVKELAERKLKQQATILGKNFSAVATIKERQGILLASGVIAGEALIGLALALLAVFGYDKIMAIPMAGMDNVVTGLGIGAAVLVGVMLYKQMANTKDMYSSGS